MAKNNERDRYYDPFPSRLRELLEDDQPGGQAKLANRLGITRQAVSTYSQGISLPDIYRFCQIADYYDVSFDYLLGQSISKKRENAEISKETGLDDVPIERIKGICKTQTAPDTKLGTLAYSREIIEPVLLNILLSTENFYNAVSQLARSIAQNMVAEKLVEVLSLQFPDNITATNDVTQYYRDLSDRNKEYAQKSFTAAFEQVFQQFAQKHAEKDSDLDIAFILQYFTDLQSSSATLAKELQTLYEYSNTESKKKGK
ncbi:MAG: helix-turn-helix domain-containing protein [Christensenellaceae bacterium]|jgi:transcriptional regulator with XRE-family HTH domain